MTTVFDDADDTLWAWQHLFNNICDEHAPWKETKIRSKSAPWITNDIRYKMNQRYKLFKTAIATKDPMVWKEYKKVRNEITLALRQAKASHYSDMFKEVKNTKAYWNLLNKATKPTVQNNIGPLRRDDGSLALADYEKACLMNSYFATIGTKLGETLPPPTDNEQNSTDEGILNVGINQPALLDEFTVSLCSVQNKISKLKTNKSTGPDNISPKILKLAGTAIVQPLVSLFRYSMECKTVFPAWKTARVMPAFKKDDEADRGNYRPISVLCVPSKIMESEVNDALVQHVFKDNNLVSDRQWAYRAGYSTELLLVHLTEEWRKLFDSGKFVAVACIDFRKAFDSVSHEILEKKLKRDFGITGTLFD
jgi:hypothetical protein